MLDSRTSRLLPLTLAFAAVTTPLASASQEAASAVQAALPHFAAAADVPVAVVRATYHVASGTLTRAATPTGLGTSAVSTSCFENTQNFGQWSLFTQHDELVDWGVKTCGLSGVVDSFTVSYRTLAVDTSLGGPGAALTVAIYAGTTGFGQTGTELLRLSLTGLPGATGNEPPGTEPVVDLTIDLSDAPLLLPDGPIGWGITNDDGLTGPRITFAPNASLGTIDALDVHRPGPATAGNYIGTFNFIGASLGSLWVVVNEDDGSVAASTQIENGTGANPLALDSFSEPRIGRNWVSVIDLAIHPIPDASLLALSTGGTPPLSTSMGELLIDPGGIIRLQVALGPHAVAIPLDLGLVGLGLRAQGLVSGSGLRLLTNAIDLTIGF